MTTTATQFQQNDTHISLYETCKHKNNTAVLISSIEAYIRGGSPPNRNLPSLVSWTRDLASFAQTDKALYSTEKTKLPAVTFSATFGARRKTGQLCRHSGYVCLDFDNCDVPSLKAELMDNPHVRFAFESPSGQGLKVVVPVSPIPEDADEHVAAFQEVIGHFERYAEIDPGQDITRLCFLAHDPRPIKNQKPIPFTWDRALYQKEKEKKRAKQARKVQQLERIRAARSATGIPSTKTPLQTYIDTLDPLAEMLRRGLLTLNPNGDYKWCEVTTPNKRSCDVENNVLKIYSQKMRAASPDPSSTQPINTHRFLLYQDYGLDWTKKADRGELQQKLAEDGYGKTWLSDEAFKAQTQSFREKQHKTTTIATDLPDDSPLYKQALEARGAAFIYWTREERTLIKALGLDPDAGWKSDHLPAWTPRFEYLFERTGHFKRNGHPEDVQHRRVWYTTFSECPHCTGVRALAIVRYELKAEWYCEACHVRDRITSYAEIEWKRKPTERIESDFHGYIDEDPKAQSIPIGMPGTLVHLGAPMNAGKTYFYHHTIVPEIQKQYPGAICLLLTARISQALGAYRERIKDMPGHWGLFCQQATRNDRFIGKHGAIATITSLPTLMQYIDEHDECQDRPIHMFIDEIDFAAELTNADIVATLAPETKALLKAHVAKTGLITAGHTETTAGLEGIAEEFGLHSVFGYYKTNAPRASTCTLYEVPPEPGKKRQMVAAAIELIENKIQDEKSDARVYVFTKSRATAQLIKRLFGDAALIYDKYHRGGTAQQRLLRDQRAETPIAIFTPAVDVGINIHDPGSVVININEENPRTGASITTAVQQPLRVRDAAHVYHFVTHFDNGLPISPTKHTQYKNAETQSTLETQEEYPTALVDHLSTRQALLELSDTESTKYLEHYLSEAGFSVRHQPAPLPTETTLERVKKQTQKMKAEVDEVLCARAFLILRANEVLHERDIHKLGAQGTLRPIPTEQQAHERASQAGLAVGYTPRLLRDRDTEALEKPIAPRQKRAALKFLAAQLNFDAFRQMRRGFIGVHFPLVAHREWQQHARSTQEVTHRPDARRLGAVLKAILEEGKAVGFEKGIRMDTFGNTIVTALQTRYGDHTLAHIVTSGMAGTPIARQVQFLNLHKPSAALCDWAKKLLEKYYPCRVSKQKIDETAIYQILAHPEIETIRECIECDIDFWAFSEPTAGNARENMQHEDLLPTTQHRMDKNADRKEKALTLWTEGKNFTAIAKRLSVHPKTAARWIKAQAPPESRLTGHQSRLTGHEYSVQGPFLNIQAPNATFEATLRSQILACLTTGEKKTSEVIGAVSGHPTSIKKELTRLVQAGVLKRVRHGVYCGTAPVPSESRLTGHEYSVQGPFLNIQAPNATLQNVASGTPGKVASENVASGTPDKKEVIRKRLTLYKP